MRKRRFCCLMLALMMLGSTHAQVGWTVGPHVPIGRTVYWIRSDGSPLPPCSGGLWLDPVVRHFGPLLARFYGALGFEVTPTAASFITGGLLNALDNRVLFQTSANCAEVCAAIPRDAKRVLRVQPFVSHDYQSERPSFVNARLSSDSGLNSFGFSEVIDTSRVTDTHRMVCVEARNWFPLEDHVAYIVVYWER